MVIIDPGHGGSDPGGGSNALWKEKDVTLDISQYQFKRFNELGIPVGMTRYEDETLTPSERTSRFNELSKRSPNAIGISNHINKDKELLDGAEIYYSVYDQSTLSEMIAKELRIAGQNTRLISQRENSQGSDYYFIIRNTRPTQTVLVEYGFADSKKNDINLLLNNREELAEAVVKAVADYMGVPYFSPYPGTKTVLTYEIKSGDTIGEIAEKFGVSSTEILEYNNVNPDNLVVGDFLKIPLDFELEGYRVQPGDTLFTIAEKYNTTVKKLMAYNQLRTLNLITSDVILVPKF